MKKGADVVWMGEVDRRGLSLRLQLDRGFTLLITLVSLERANSGSSYLYHISNIKP
jgi:hypothetical protein